MAGKQFVVCRNTYGVQYLILVGPFQYPYWTAEVERCTVLSMQRAYQAAEAFGGEAVEVH